MAKANARRALDERLDDNGGEPVGVEGWKGVDVGDNWTKK